MSHFTVLVGSPTADDLETLLAPFDENLETPRYLKRTREQIIADGRADIERYRDGLYARYLADPDAYAADCSNAAHLRYLRQEFPQKLEWTDEQVYAEEVRWIEAEDLDDNGAEWSEYNPNAQWDYWRVGGRWAGHLTLRPGATGLLEPLSWEWKDSAVEDRPKVGVDASQAAKSDVDLDATKPTYAVLLPDGTWIGRGSMGWFGISRDTVTEDEWPALWRQAVDSIPDDHVLTVVDCHI